MRTEKIDRIVQKIDQIPTLPIISKKIMRLFDDENVSIKQISEIIEKDPPLALKILKIVNSAFYGQLNNVSSIDHALVILGFGELKNVVLGFSIQNFFRKSSKNFDPTRFWKHSIICSQITKLLVKYFKIVDDGTYFLSGLIHDMGKLVIDQNFQKEFVSILDYISANNTTFSRAEKKIMGVTHYQVAARLLQKWQFPKKVIMQVFYHHAPWYDKNFTHGSIITYLANILTKSTGFTCFEHEKEVPPSKILSPSVLKFINRNGFDIDQESFQVLTDNMNEFIASESDSMLKIFG